MNVNLTAPSPKQRKVALEDQNKNLGFGLNSRRSDARPFKKSVLADSSSSSEDDEGGRKVVNKALAFEQSALRKRALAATAASTDVYDYDGQYDSFRSTQNEAEKTAKKKESRYVSALLRKASHRNQERELVLERKLAKDQESEEFSGKEKFITKAYKRKLEEREQFLMDEAKKDEKDQKTFDNDNGAGVVAGFYGNFSKSVGFTGVPVVASQETQGKLEHSFITTDYHDKGFDGNKDDNQNDANAIDASTFSPRSTTHRVEHEEAAISERRGRKRFWDDKVAAPAPSDQSVDDTNVRGNVDMNNNASKDKGIGSMDLKKPAKQTLRANRIQKIVAARERYLHRKALEKETDIHS